MALINLQYYYYSDELISLAENITRSSPVRDLNMIKTKQKMDILKLLLQRLSTLQVVQKDKDTPSYIERSCILKMCVCFGMKTLVKHLAGKTIKDGDVIKMIVSNLFTWSTVN